MSKYQKLTLFLAQQQTAHWTASFKDVENVLGFDLPESARRHRPWWANQKGMNHSQTKGWMSAGWMTEDVSLEDERVTFVRRQVTRPNVVQPRAEPVTQSAAVAPLRQGLSISEAKLALAQFYDTTTDNIEITVRG